MPCFQNCQTNTCKNEPAKPVFMRVPRGYRRNEKSPFKGIDTLFAIETVNTVAITVEMRRARSRALTHRFVKEL